MKETKFLELKIVLLETPGTSRTQLKSGMNSNAFVWGYRVCRLPDPPNIPLATPPWARGHTLGWDREPPKPHSTFKIDPPLR